MDFTVSKKKRPGKPRIWIHPVTGEPKFPMADEPMPDRYKMLGYEEKVFDSYFEHQRWCKSKGLVNHAADGIREGNDIQKNRWGY
jgi:hypothetical protein